MKAGDVVGDGDNLLFAHVGGDATHDAAGVIFTSSGIFGIVSCGAEGAQLAGDIFGRLPAKCGIACGAVAVASGGVAAGAGGDTSFQVTSTVEGFTARENFCVIVGTIEGAGAYRS